MNENPKSKVRVHMVVSGLVQGVFFRANTKSEAERLGVFGWARNLMTGDVEITAEGEKEIIDKFVQWCHKGPPGSEVSKVDEKWEEYRDEFKSFRIVY